MKVTTTTSLVTILAATKGYVNAQLPNLGGLNLGNLNIGALEAQFGALYSCVSNCANQQQISCSISDIKCICSASQGNKLANVILCAKQSCESRIDVDPILNFISIACSIAGNAIPASVISSAESVASTISGSSSIVLSAPSSASSTMRSSATASATAIATGGGIVSVLSTALGSAATAPMPNPTSTAVMPPGNPGLPGGVGVCPGLPGGASHTQITTTDSYGSSYVVVVPIVVSTTSGGMTLSTSTATSVVTITPGQQSISLPSASASSSVATAAIPASISSVLGSVTSTVVGSATSTGSSVSQVTTTRVTSGTTTGTGVQTATTNAASSLYQMGDLRMTMGSLFLAVFAAAFMA